MQNPSTDFFYRIILTVSFLFFWTFSFTGYSQHKSQDIQLIARVQNQEVTAPKEKKKVKFTQAINPVYWVYKGGIGLYQKHISPQLSTHCIFETSCSRFSRKLIDSHGLVKGLFLTCDRLNRCNRLTLAQTSRLRFNKNGRVKEDVSSFSFKK